MGNPVSKFTDGRSCSTNSGLLDSLNVSLRCGCSENARQMRCTVETDRPDALGHRACTPGALRRPAWSPRVVVTTSVILSSPILRGAPGRGSSSSHTETLRRKPIAPGRHRDPRGSSSRLAMLEIGHAARPPEARSRRAGRPPASLPPPRPRLKFGVLSACQFDPNRSTAPHPCFPPNTRQAQGITAKQICLETSETGH